MKTTMIAALLLAACGTTTPPVDLSGKIAPDKWACYPFDGGQICGVDSPPLCTHLPEVSPTLQEYLDGMLFCSGLTDIAMVFPSTICDPTDAGASCLAEVDDRCVYDNPLDGGIIFEGGDYNPFDAGWAGYWTGTVCQ